MNQQTVSRAKSILLLVPMTMVVLTLACGGSATVRIKLSEEDVNRIIQNSTVTIGPDELLVEISSVDMQDGFIRINGTHERGDGTIVPGSCDLTFTVQDSMLRAEITAVDIAGIDINEQRITRINDELAKSFTKSASNTDEVEFTSVTITKDALTFVIKITPSQ
ncbi:MAG: hypothetical protein GY832_25890 [Chloroflexi bacterium]|nr:hypothetical protein [Chloroflexota bacterium]